MLTITEFIEYKKSDIDIDIFNLLHDVIKNKSWIFVSNKIIHNWIGYKKTESSTTDFYKKLKYMYEINTDYKEVDKSHELIIKYNMMNKKIENRGGFLKKYYIISDKTLVLCLLKANTKESHRILEYFYEIHSLLISYYEYQATELKLDYDNELIKIRNMEHNKKYTLEQEKKYLKEEDIPGYVYFINEINDLDYFKIGFTTNINMRLMSLQSGNRRKLNIYKYIECINPNTIENILHKKFKNQQILNEWFKISTMEIELIIKVNFQDILLLNLDIELQSLSL